MKKWIAILSGLLILQLALALGLNLAGEDYAAFEPTEQLLAFEPAVVDGVRIEDGEASVELTRRDGAWVLPGRGGFPADQDAVERLIEKLAALQKGWPVATTAGAVERFKVSDEAYERRISLLAGGTPKAALYVGTSPGFRKVHVRPSGDEAVYAAAFDTWEARTRADDWIDKSVLALDEAEVTRIELPGLVLERDGDGFRVAGLAEGEEGNPDESRALVETLARLRVESLLDAGGVPADEPPVLELTVTRSERGPLTYRVWKPGDGGDYALTRSDFEQGFGVAGYSIEPLLTASREKLVSSEAADGPDAVPPAAAEPEAKAAPAPGQ